VEFWGHCSNLQVWDEHDYNTRLLHSNLAFPLLKKLTELGDIRTKKIFKGEIGRRYENGPDSVKNFLVLEEFLDVLNRDEFWSVIPNSHDTEILHEVETILETPVRLYSNDSEEFLGYNKRVNEVGFPLKEERVNRMEFYDCISFERKTWSFIMKKISNLSNLLDLKLLNNQLTECPKEIGQVKNLRNLELSSNCLTSLPTSIGNLGSLVSLYIDNNKLKYLPKSIKGLVTLKKLNIYKNELKALPSTIGKLKSLEKLSLRYNNLESLPKSIGELTNLKELALSNNRLTEIPRSLKKLESLKAVSLDGNKSLLESLSSMKIIKNLREKGVTVILRELY